MDEPTRRPPPGLIAARVASSTQTPASNDMEILLRRVERERQARKEAEQLLEHKALELYEANQTLHAQAAKLEIDLQERTRALDEALASMQNSSRAEGEFLAVVSHEIRTPMNGVLGMAQLLQMTELTEEQRRYVETIQSSGETLLTIINDILDLSKLDAGKVTLAARPVDLRSVVAEVIDLLRPQAQHKGLYLDTEIDKSVPAWIVGDATRLKQVLTNLVGNAVKFTHHGGVQVFGRILPDATMLECKVVDSGIGIPADKTSRLFKKFSQVDSSINRRYGGTGLGLVITKRLVEGMGGTISVESKQRQGSTFTFCLPVTVSQAPGEATGPRSAGSFALGVAHPAGRGQRRKPDARLGRAAEAGLSGRPGARWRRGCRDDAGESLRRSTDGHADAQDGRGERHARNPGDGEVYTNRTSSR